MLLKYIPRNIAVLGNGRGYNSFLRHIQSNKIPDTTFTRSISFFTDYGFVFFDYPLNQSSKHLYNLTHFGPKPIPYLKFWPKVTNLNSKIDSYYFLEHNSDPNWPKILKEIIPEEGE